MKKMRFPQKTIIYFLPQPEQIVTIITLQALFKGVVRNLDQSIEGGLQVGALFLYTVRRGGTAGKKFVFLAGVAVGEEVGFVEGGVLGHKAVAVESDGRIAGIGPQGKARKCGDADVGLNRVVDAELNCVGPQQVMSHENVGYGKARQFKHRRGDVDLGRRGGIAGGVQAFAVNHEGYPAHIGKSTAVHGRDTIFAQGESVVRHDNHVGILVPFLVFYRADEPGQLPVGIAHGHVDPLLQGAILFFIGHARRKVEGVMVGAGHEGGQEGLSALGQRVANVFDGVVHEGGVVFSLAVVMLLRIPLGHPDAQIVPGGIGGRHVVGTVTVLGQYRDKARERHVGKVGGLCQAGMMRDANVGRKHAAGSGNAAGVHAHPHVGMCRQGIHKGRRRRLDLRVHVTRVETPLGFHQHQNEIGPHFPLGCQFFALEQGLGRFAVKGQVVAGIAIYKLPKGIPFHLLPQILVGHTVICQVRFGKTLYRLGFEQVPINQRYHRSKLCHAGVACPDKVNEQVGDDVEHQHGDDGFFHVEVAFAGTVCADSARAIPLAEQAVQAVGRRQHQQEHHELQVRHRQIVGHVVVEHDDGRSVLVGIHQPEGQVPAQETLGLVVQKGEQQDCAMKNGIEDSGDFCNFLTNCSFRVRFDFGYKKCDQRSQGNKHHQGVHNPHEVDADRMKDEPVRLRDKGETVGVAAKQQQDPQDDVDHPHRQGYQDKLLKGGESASQFLENATQQLHTEPSSTI